MSDHLNISNAFDERLKRFLPKEGWLSRQELILSIQFAFRQKPIVLLIGENGSGKTSSAAGFALSEATSGALDHNPVLYSSFGECRNFTELLDSFGRVYEFALLERQIEWQTLDDFQRQKLVEDILHSVTLFWIWDDFELVREPFSQSWEAEDRQQLLNLLDSIPRGGGRILILSNNDELDILRDLPERVQNSLSHPNPLAQEIARVLEGFSQLSPVQIKSLDLPRVSRKPDSGLDKTLRFALAQLSVSDQKMLSLMGLFHGILNLEILCGMSEVRSPWQITDIPEMHLEYARKVFDQAANWHLCTPIQSTSYYLLHPAITDWFGKRLSKESLRIARRAFTLSMANFAHQSVNQVKAGKENMVDLLAVEEANLRQALVFADRFRWRGDLINLLAALCPVYLKSRRYATWMRLLEQVSRHFIHPDTHQPVSRKDQLIKEFIPYLVEVATKREQLSQAARWQAIMVIWDRQQSQTGEITKSRRSVSTSHDLAESLAKLGAIYRQIGSPKAIESYMEAFQIAVTTGERSLASYYACKIAEAYVAIPVVQDLDQAESWTQKSLDLLGEQDDLLRSRSIALRGAVSYERFLKARKTNQPQAEQVSFLNQALSFYFEALELIPENDLPEQSSLNETIGLLYLQSQGLLETAIEFYNEAIEQKEQSGDVFGAAQARYNLAVALFLVSANESDFSRSRNYAEAALRGFEVLGVDAMKEAQKVRSFLARFPG